MKIKNLFFAALSILILAACTDTPDSPYDFPGIGGNDNPTEEGTNLLVNSDFETWENNVPTGWGQTVSNCTYTQSTDAHSGSSAVVVEGYSQSNKRFASKSYTLKPGTYTISAYLKKSGETLGQYRLGYAKLTNGVVADTQNDYVYITSATTVPSDWKKATCNFTIDAETEVGIIIMNSKYGEGASILVDDVTLTTTDGGLVEGTDEPETPTDAYISETFATSFGAFTTQETVGNYPWVIDYSCAKVTGYESASKVNNAAESWLVSPAVDFTSETEAYIAFDYVIRYTESGKVAEHNQLLISDNFTGDVATATWTVINYNPQENTVDWTFSNSGKIAVPAEFIGKANVTIAFKYTSTETKAGTWEVKNVVVASGKGETPETPDTPEEPETPDTPDTPVVPSGDNLLANGGFEEWNGDAPAAWGTGNIGHNATISQSTTAYAGSYAVSVSGSATNKRLGSQKYTLAAGTYTLGAYIKHEGATAAAFKLGYGIIKNGAITNADYKYQATETYTTADWTLYTYEFTLTEETEVAILVMNHKKGNGASFLVDNVTLTTADGNVSGGGNDEGDNEQPETPADSYAFTAVTSITSGAEYLIVAGTNQATALDASKSYGYLPVTSVNPSNGVINTTADNVFVIEAVAGGYSIKDALGRYLYMKGDYNSVNLDTTLPAEGGVWTIEFNADGTAKITNTYNSKFMQFDSQYNSYGIYPDARGTMPTLYKKN